MIHFYPITILIHWWLAAIIDDSSIHFYDQHQHFTLLPLQFTTSINSSEILILCCLKSTLNVISKQSSCLILDDRLCEANFWLRIHRMQWFNWYSSTRIIWTQLVCKLNRVTMINFCLITILKVNSLNALNNSVWLLRKIYIQHCLK